MRKEQQTNLLDHDETDSVADLVTRASDTYASSQADLARTLGVQPLALTQWRGGRRRPSPTTLRKMAREFIRQSDELRYLSLQLEALAERETKRTRKSSNKKRKAGGSAAQAAAEKRIAKITALAEEVYADPEQARVFLNSVHPRLGKMPIEVARTTAGGTTVEGMLYGLEYSLPV